MNKLKPFFIKLWRLIKQFPKLIKARTMSTQLIFTIILIFGSFFLLQTFLNNTFFQSYYTERQFERIKSNIDTYVTELKENEIDNEHYNAIFEYTSTNNAYSLIVDRDYNILTSSYNNYTVKVKESITNNIYEFYVPNNDYQYSVSDIITVSLKNYENSIAVPSDIFIEHTRIYTSGLTCESIECISIEGTVVEVNKPNNLNYLFDKNIAVQQEITKLHQLVDERELLEEYSNDNSWYISKDGPINTLVFVNDLKYNTVVTLMPIANTDDVVTIISGYNYYIYLTALVIIFLWSFRMSNIISKPIKNIELVAREIAQLNFNVEAHEYNNRENESLSKSINLISRNLNETLETINAKNEELTALYEGQSKQIALKKQLVSSISHELKTPLMIMMVTIQGILDGIIDESEQETELNNIIDEINKSSIMIQDMLQIYRLDDAKTQLDLNYFNLGDIVTFFVKDFEKAFKKYDFQINMNIDPKTFIEADCKLIKRVISNFITNAIKYTPEGEEIYIEVSQTENEAYFELTNHGISIASKDIENVWLPFYRLEQDDSTKRKSKGSGVGLYLVSEILKAHQAEYGMVSDDNFVKSFFKISKNR
jgi:signal transduction histidine kinase